MVKQIAWIMGVVLACASILAQAEILVSKKFQTHPLDQAVNIQAGGYWIWPLPGRIAGDVYRVRVDSENGLWKDISAFVVDETNLEPFKYGKQFFGTGKSKGATPFEFQVVRSTPKQLYLVIDNRYSLLTTKKARVSVTVFTELDGAQTKKLQEFLGAFYASAQKNFELPEFDVKVNPCNSVNAFSEHATGSITLCSEMISKYGDRPSVLAWILLHELGHSALGLWGIPGNDNEDIADEFATAITLGSKHGPRVIQEAMDSFQDADLNAEIQNMVQRGDRHSLSIQRIKNIRSWLVDPVRVTAKWNNLLYPHMTEEGLKNIVAKPGPYDNRELAQGELTRRFTLAGTLPSAISTREPVFGCSKDTDCKGVRVCERGLCVNP